MADFDRSWIRQMTWSVISKHMLDELQPTLFGPQQSFHGTALFLVITIFVTVIYRPGILVKTG